MHGNQEIYKHLFGAFFHLNGILLKSFYYIYKEEDIFFKMTSYYSKGGARPWEQ